MKKIEFHKERILFYPEGQVLVKAIKKDLCNH
jgi:hypothetical protein